MNKEEIISKKEGLVRRVKTPGRAYSKAQREKMKEEISVLEIELEKIKFEEDLAYINDFQQKYPSHFIHEKEELKKQIDEIKNNITDPKLLFILEFKIKSFYNDWDYISSYQKEIGELKDALSCIDRNEKIPTDNPNRFKKKEEIQKFLAATYRTLNARINQLNSTLNEIQRIINFFLNDNKLTGFVYLSDAVFSEASNFEKGYATVEQGSKKMYFDFNGNTYSNESNVAELPKIEKQRENPDLIPFEINEETNYLKGYKNSEGKIIIPAKFKYASQFVNGYAKVGILKEKYTKYTYGLIDHTGRIVLPCDFIELGDVYNDIVLYQKHIYSKEYVGTSSFNFDIKQEVKHIGLFSGYLKLGEIKPAIIKEIEKIQGIENSIKTLKTNGEIDKANNLIKKHRDIIDFYLKYVVDNEDK